MGKVEGQTEKRKEDETGYDATTFAEIWSLLLPADKRLSHIPPRAWKRVMARVVKVIKLELR